MINKFNDKTPNKLVEMSIPRAYRKTIDLSSDMFLNNCLRSGCLYCYIEDDKVFPVVEPSKLLKTIMQSSEYQSVVNMYFRFFNNLKKYKNYDYNTIVTEYLSGKIRENINIMLDKFNTCLENLKKYTKFIFECMKEINSSFLNLYVVNGYLCKDIVNGEFVIDTSKSTKICLDISVDSFYSNLSLKFNFNKDNRFLLNTDESLIKLNDLEIDYLRNYPIFKFESYINDYDNLLSEFEKPLNDIGFTNRNNISFYLSNGTEVSYKEGDDEINFYQQLAFGINESFLTLIIRLYEDRIKYQLILT